MPRKQPELLALIKQEYFNIDRFAKQIGYSRCLISQIVHGRLEPPVRTKRYLSWELTGTPDYEQIFIDEKLPEACETARKEDQL